MTTYYLKSQLTEKLGTDANLAEQIELTPQTAKTFSGSGYYRQSAALAGTVSDVLFLPAFNTRFDYLSVKNTGTNPLILMAANKITDLSLTVSTSVTDTTSAGSGAVGVGKTTFTSTNDASMKKLGFYAAFSAARLRVGNNSYKILAATASAGGDSVVLNTSSSFSGAFSAETFFLNTLVVPVGQTIVTVADGNFSFDGSNLVPFVLYSNSNDGVLPFQSLEAVVTGISA